MLQTQNAEVGPCCDLLCHLLAECVGNPTSWSVVGQKPVLQVNGSLSDEIIGREAIIVHDLYMQLVMNWECGRDLKHLPKEWIEVVGNVILLVINFLLPNFYHQKGIRLGRERERERGGTKRWRERGRKEEREGWQRMAPKDEFCKLVCYEKLTFPLGSCGASSIPYKVM